MQETLGINLWLGTQLPRLSIAYPASFFTFGLHGDNAFVFAFAAGVAFVNQMAGIYNRANRSINIYRHIYH